MKRLLLAALLGIGLLLALANAPNLGAQGTYDSIALDFQETLPDAQIQQQVEAMIDTGVTVVPDGTWALVASTGETSEIHRGAPQGTVAKWAEGAG